MQAMTRQRWTKRPTKISWPLIGKIFVFSFALLLASRSVRAQYLAYVPNSTDGTVSVIDTASNTVVATVTVGASPMSVAASPDSAFVYVANASSPGAVSVINTSTNNVIATIPVGNVPIGVTVAPNGKFAYVSNTGDNTISVIDTFAQSVSATIPLPAGICGPNSPCGIAFTQKGAYAYVAGNSGNRVAVISTATNTVTTTISTSANTEGTIAISPDQSTAYVPLNLGYVSVISTTTNTQTATWSLNGGAAGISLYFLAVTPDSASVYIEASGQNRVIAVPAATGTASASILVGNNPIGLGMTPDGAYIYVPNSNDATVSVIQVATNSVVGTIQVGNGPSGVAIAKPLDYAFLNGGNSFNGNQVVNGNVSATNFAGNGSGLTGVLAAGLACAGCVTNSQLGVNYAGSTSQGGPATDALMLDGLPATAFASTGANSFTGDQNITGNLTTTGAVNAASLNLTGPFSTSNLVLPPGGTATASQGFNSGALDSSASLFNSTTSSAQSFVFRWQAEPVTSSNNTANPAATLNLLYGANGTPSETGLSLNANGTINFAAGQTFPGAGGSGSITGVTAGTGLAGGGTSGNVTLNLANNACAAGSALTALPFTCSPFASTGANTFSGNQIVTGTVSASAFSGDGSGLTNISAATAATAANALALGGLAPSAYATTGGNTFSGTQTISSGDLSLPNTSSAGASGVITLGGIPFIHNFGAGSGAAGNTFIGQGAGNFTMAATEDTVSGFDALNLNTTGSGNTASGFRALGSNSTGSYNTASGSGVLYSNTTGRYNTVSGVEALTANTSGSFNTVVGANAGIENSSGSYNTFLGYSSGPGTGTPLTNATAIGTNAVVSANNALVLGSINGVNGATASVNVGIGTATPAYALDVEGGQINASGGLCIAGSCLASWPAGGIVAVGSSPSFGTVTATSFSGGSFSGSGAGLTALNPANIAAGTASISITGNAATATTAATAATATNALALGGLAPSAYATTGPNTFMATQTIGTGNLGLPNTVSSGASGVITFGGSPFVHNFGTQNTFVGQGAGNFTMTGYSNAAGGFAALYSNTAGSNDTASGASALFSNTQGSNNTADGAYALVKNTTGLQNTASGEQALESNTTGDNNSASGYDALSNSTTAFDNTANGAFAMDLNTTGVYNAALGFEAGTTMTAANANLTGSYNSFVGANSGPGTSTQLTNATAIGANAVVSTNNALVLGSINGVNGATASVKVGIGTATPAYALDVEGGQINASGGLCIAGACWTTLPPGTGTVTSVATGAGLTGGPVTSSGTISVATGGITNTMLAANSVSSADLAAGSVTSSAIAAGSIVDSNISSAAAISPTKINGTAATLGANNFAGTQSMPSLTVSGPGTFGGNMGVSGSGTFSTGVIGIGSSTIGVEGSSNSAYGVFGVSGNSDGVFGQSSGTSTLTAAAVFNNAAGSNLGNILLGQSAGINEFTVDAKGDVVANGSVTIGGGTAIKEHLSILFSNVAAIGKMSPGSCTVQSYVFPGASDGDSVEVGMSSSIMSANIVFSAWAGNGTVNVRICNPTGAPTTVGSGNIRVDIWKH